MDFSELHAGRLEVVHGCRPQIGRLREAIAYARRFACVDVTRTVEALRNAGDLLEDLAVDIELLAAGLGADGAIDVDGVGDPPVRSAETVDSEDAGDGASEEVAASLAVECVQEAPPSPKRPAPKNVRSGRGETAGHLALVEEQQAVVDSNADLNVVQAGAGTGKTTTCEGIALARGNQRLLYVAYSRAVVTAGGSRFPKNVTCRTSHQVAFADVGLEFEGKIGDLRARDAASFLAQQKRMAVDRQEDVDAFAQVAVDAVSQYLCSAGTEYEITRRDVEDSYLLPSGTHVEGRYVIRAAQCLWEGMQDARNEAIRMPHDGYLKLWQLRRPKLDRYQAVLLDEAQDSNAALLAAVLEQECDRFIVGDDHQAIFAYRNAVNALQKISGAQRFELRHSFRFGQGIASIANDLIRVFKGGGGGLIGRGGADRKRDGSVAALFRTNAALFQAAAEWIDRRDGRPGARGSELLEGIGTSRGLHLVGGVKGCKFERIVDAHWLRSGERRKIRDPFMKRFVDFDGMQSYARAVKDRELLGRIALLDRFGERIPYLAGEIGAAQRTASTCDIVLSTAHGAKGLEWDSVRMADDFPSLLDRQGLPRSEEFCSGLENEQEPLPVDEINLLYVVATRARFDLAPSRSLGSFLKWLNGAAGATESVAS